VAYGPRPVGHVLRASLAMFYDLRDGRIVGIRNYDCYEP
jgi:ketosteroid isomerase-like protein